MNLSEFDKIYRQYWGEVTSHLTRKFGVSHIDMVESAVQDAFIKALDVWKTGGQPKSPKAWLIQVAGNHVLGELRKVKRHIGKEVEIVSHVENLAAENDENFDVTLNSELSDDLLRMLFVCCHPEIPEDSRLPLTLKTLCGFEIPEIARTFLVSEDALAKKLVRARKSMRELNCLMEFPGPAEVTDRLDSVFKILYLIFNEGYSAHSGEKIIREDYCEEAIRLTVALSKYEPAAGEECFALLALMMLVSARFPARTGPDGELIDLRNQDRGLWDQLRLRSGYSFLQKASTGYHLSRYHLEAMIAGCHGRAPGHETTDWLSIANLYGILLEFSPSPFVEMNRAIALGFARGAKEGLKELKKLASEKVLVSHYLYCAAIGEFERMAGNMSAARKAYEKALTLVFMDAERKALQRKLDALESN